MRVCTELVLGSSFLGFRYVLDEHKRIDVAIGLVAIGRYRDAEVTLRQLLESSSTNAQFYRNLAAICQRTQPLEEGL